MLNHSLLRLLLWLILLSLALNRECPAIVIDLLEVLCMDELRLRVSSRGDEEDPATGFAGEENGLTTVPTTTPSTRHTRKKEQFILNAIKLKTMIESILPPLTMLKSRYVGVLQRVKSLDKNTSSYCFDH